MSHVFPPSPAVAVPVAGTAQTFPVHRVYCVGRNYVEHAREMGFTGREPPFFFMKPADAIVVVPEGTTGEIPYPPMAVVCLGYRAEQIRHPVDGFGFLAPRSSGLRVLGALWASATFPDNAPPGHVLLRVMIGGARDEGVLELDDSELQRLVCEELARVQGISGAPTYARIFRHTLAIPQYLVGHGERLARIEACLQRWPRLAIAGNAYRGIGVNDCAREAWPIAERVLEGAHGQQLTVGEERSPTAVD